MSKTKLSTIEHMDTSLRTFFAQIYNFMAAGLGLSALVAYFAARPPFLRLFYTVHPTGELGLSILGIIAVLSPLILIFMMGSAANQANAAKAKTLFWIFSALMGVSLSNLFFLFDAAQIFQAFLVTAAMFAGMSLYGYTTKKSLASWGSFLFMGLLGVIVASFVNFFTKSSAFEFWLNLIAVLIFVGLTAYDTQRLKGIHNPRDHDDVRTSKAIWGALSLYLNFINLFRLMLYFLNSRR